MSLVWFNTVCDRVLFVFVKDDCEKMDEIDFVIDWIMIALCSVK